MFDIFDPNNWEDLFRAEEQRECRIYGDDNAQTYCVVDFEDYHWAMQRKWHPNKPHPKRNGTKQYYRSRAGWQSHLEHCGEYLHVAILKRAGVPPPTPKHTLVDHIDGNEWNCRRGNLTWCTAVRNRRTSRQKGGDKYGRVPAGMLSPGVDVSQGGPD